MANENKTTDTKNSTISRIDLKDAISQQQNATPASVAKLISALISGIAPGDRRDVIAVALRDAPATKSFLVPWFLGIPGDISTDEARQLMNGMGLRLIATAALDPRKTTIAQMEQYAASLASGKPFAGDPTKEIDGTSKVLPAIIELSDIAVPGSSKTEPVLRAMKSLDENDWVTALSIASSESHPLAGGNFMDKLSAFLKPVGDAVKTGLTAAAGAAGEAISDEAERKLLTEQYTRLWPEASPEQIASAVEAQIVARLRSGGAASNMLYSPNGSIALQQYGPNGLTNVIQTSMSELRSSLAMYTSQMQNAMAQITEVKKATKDANLDFARISWAAAALEADDDAAQIMALVSPQFDTSDAFVRTIFDTIPAARMSGDLSLISAIGRGVKAAFSSGSIPQAALDALGLTGDPISAMEIGAGLDAWQEGYVDE